MPDPTHPRRVIRFGAFEADLSSGELWKHGHRIRLPEQPFQVLTLLLNHPGQVLTRELLQKKLWSADTFVDFDTGLNSAVKKLRHALGDSPENPRFIETLPRRGYRFIGRIQPPDPDLPPPRIESLAVLPLQNLTGDPSQDYFADAMTDALITRLAQISALRVTSRTSVAVYKGASKPLPQIAAELGVEGVVEGTVLRAGGRIRITAQLVYAPGDRHLWAAEYERELGDILLLQAQVARAIADEIRVRVTPQEQARLADSRAVHPEAYDEFLRGRLHWSKRTEQGLLRALHHFRQSVEKDPTWALGHTGLADTYSMLGYWGLLAPGQAYPAALAAASKAMELEPTLGEVWAARAWLRFYEWDWVAAERELKHAIELNPRYTTARQWYSHVLAYQGRCQEAFAQVRQTLELEPVSLIMNSSGAFIYLFAREFGEAIERAGKTVELDPNFAPPHLCLGMAHTQTGLYAQAVRELQTAVTLSERAPRYLASLAHGLARAGDARQAHRLFAELQELAGQRYVSPYEFAIIHAGLGDTESALARLEQAIAERSSWTCLLRADSRLDLLHHEPRFKEMVRRTGLATE